ncbi:MAG: DUF1971 domain-containing protein [Vicinamibacterales bacterium]
MTTMPDGAVAFRRSPTFTETTVPPGLLRHHTTAPGTWARIVVVEGRLVYRILAPELQEVELTPARHGVVEPGVPHEVRPDGPVTFYVEFCRVD